MKPLALGKQHKLCSTYAIDALFASRAGAQSTLAYPLRAVWQRSESRRDNDGGFDRFLISIPKKRLRRAVDRVRMRRLVREAYRLSWHDYESGSGEAAPVDIAFIYVADSLKDYALVVKAMRRILAVIHPQSCVETDSETSPKAI